jgi:hypothetical protein
MPICALQAHVVLRSWNVKYFAWDDAKNAKLRRTAASGSRTLSSEIRLSATFDFPRTFLRFLVSVPEIRHSAQASAV